MRLCAQTDVDIMSVHAFAGDPHKGETVAIGRFLVERPGRCSTLKQSDLRTLLFV
jgi:hypothetical protein